jgi:hypothetical protein
MSWIDPDDPEAKPRRGPRPNGCDEPVQIHDAGDIDVTEIPPRGWLLGTTFCRKFISGLIAEGGSGKTAIRYAQYLASASGHKLTGEYVHHQSRVLIVCLEDDLDEVRRRIGAAMLHHGVTPEAVRGSLYYCTPRGLKLLQTDPRGARTVGALNQELRKTVEELNIDIVGIDPFVKAHGVEENDNNAIDEVCIMLADIGAEFDCAIDIVSHARKGTATPGDADRDRGASSKKDAGRLIRTVTGMTTDEAELFGVAAADRLLLLRVDDAKVNLTVRAPDTMWFKMVGVPLGNGTERYPNGDNIQTVERWTPTDAFAKLNVTAIEHILNRMEAGPYEGGRYSPAANATDRAAWPLVQQICPDLNAKQAKHVINTWIKNGILVKREHEDPKDRHTHPSLFVGKRPGNTWEA